MMFRFTNGPAEVESTEPRDRLEATDGRFASERTFDQNAIASFLSSVYVRWHLGQ